MGRSSLVKMEGTAAVGVGKVMLYAAAPTTLSVFPESEPIAFSVRDEATATGVE
jgi:hypothetical protein